MLRVVSAMLLLSATLAACPDTDMYCVACSGNFCTLCLHSFLYNGVCNPVSYVVPNCISYSSPTTCQACQQGFYLEASGACVKIPYKNCAEVDAFGQCSVCFNGKRVENGQCGSRKCLTANCAQCRLDEFGNEQCVRCKDNHVIAFAGNVNTCVRQTTSVDHCLYASRLNPNLCSVCELNYYHRNGQCVKSSAYFFGSASKLAAFAGLLAFAFAL